MDIQPNLLADALRRVLGQKGWTVVDLREEPDRHVDILLLSHSAERRSAAPDDVVVVVLPGLLEDAVGLDRYRDGTESSLAEDGNHLDQLLALLSCYST